MVVAPYLHDLRQRLGLDNQKVPLFPLLRLDELHELVAHQVAELVAQPVAELVAHQFAKRVKELLAQQVANLVAHTKWQNK